MVDYKAAWASLREAVKELPGMAPAIGVVILALTASLVSWHLGSAKASIFGVLFAALGFVLVVLLRYLGKPPTPPPQPPAAPTAGPDQPTSSTTVPPSPAEPLPVPQPAQPSVLPNDPVQDGAYLLVKTVARAMCALVVLLLCVVTFGLPCPLARLLDIESELCKDPCLLARFLGMPDLCPGPVRTGVHIKRDVDYTGSRCVEGARQLKEVVTDELTFEGNIDEYTIQAKKTAIKNTELRVKYSLGGKEVLLAPDDWLPDSTEAERWTYPVQLNGNSLRVTYEWDQKPEAGDDLFTAVALVSSVKILSLDATIRLPKGKHILAFNEKYAKYAERLKAAKCAYHPGDPPTYTCNRPLNNEANVPMAYAVTWDVFSECEPQAPSH